MELLSILNILSRLIHRDIKLYCHIMLTIFLKWQPENLLRTYFKWPMQGSRITILLNAALRTLISLLFYILIL